MATNTRTLAEMQAEMSNDEATGWVRVGHWSRKIDENVTRHMILKNRTIIREYAVDWSDGKPFVYDAPAEYSNVGSTITSADLKTQGYKRHGATTMYNEVTRELATL